VLVAHVGPDQPVLVAAATISPFSQMSLMHFAQIGIYRQPDVTTPSKANGKAGASATSSLIGC
jgi:hypothetical protein